MSTNYKIENINNRFYKCKMLSKRIIKNKLLYLMLIPVIAHYIIFHYLPMYGVIIAFKTFRPSMGILGSPWAGLVYFEQFFSSYYFFRIIRNTFILNIYQLIFVFPAPIILALLLNEIRSNLYKRFVQTISYLPHFISVVITVGFIMTFFSREGFVNYLLGLFGISPQSFLVETKWFRPIYIGSDIWQGIGWGSIIYLAAISSINPELYEAAIVDGANRFKRIYTITIPSIMPTITILLILRIGGIMSIGFEKVFLLYNPLVYETADVISTFVYRSGLVSAQYSYAAAVGLFNSVINFVFLFSANYISRRVNKTSLW